MTMDPSTSLTLLILGVMVVVAVTVWSVNRPARSTPATAKLARELAELGAGIAAARREVTALRDDAGRLRGDLGAAREDA